MQKLFAGFILLLVFLTAAENGQAQPVNFQDGFEDGNFTQDPVWTGDTSQFKIINETINNHQNHLLRLNGDSIDGGTSYLSAPLQNIVGSWEFYIYMGFSPSSTSYAEIFLMSDTADLSGAVSGYAIQAGESGSDDVFRLVRYDNGTSTPILSGKVDIHSGGKFRVKVIRQTEGKWTLEVGTGYSGILSNEGTKIDSTYNLAQYFGVGVHYIASRAHKFYFDFKIDLPPFKITKVVAQNDTVDVTFNHPYDQNSIDLNDFSIGQGVGNPVSKSYLSPKTVQLQYNNALPSEKYTLTVKNVSDQQGNQISDTTASFIVFANYAKGDVIINEFMYDPLGGQSEYVELKNTSGKYLNLQNWQIVDNMASHKTPISANPVVLQPDSLLVLSGDTTALYNIYDHRHYLQSSIPSLNNSGDAIKIFTRSNLLVDSLTYTADWGGNNVSLERRSDTVPAIYKGNFGDSPNPSGGTPGLPNEVAPDTAPPSLADLVIVNEQIVTLVFSERLKYNRATDAANYALNNGMSVDNAQQITPDSIRLKLSSKLKNGTTYQLTINNQQDIFGNTAASLDTSFTYYKTSRPKVSDVFINEFIYDPPTGSTEYVEIYNPTSKSFNLQGWTINDNTGHPQTITNQQTILPPDSFVVLAPDQTLLSHYPDINLVTLASHWPSLNNSGDAIVIRDSAGVALDSLSYFRDWGGNEQALERRSTQVPPMKANFGENPNGFGSPGSTNGVPPDKIPPALEQLQILGERSLQLVFSETLNKTRAVKKGNYSLSEGLSIKAIHFAGLDTVCLELAKPMTNGTTYRLSIHNQQDIFSNVAATVDTSFTYYQISRPKTDNVFINEFIYDPPNGFTEYIELYNPTSRSFNLQGWTINNRGGDRQTITDRQIIIPPDSFVVLAPDRSLLEKYPAINLVSLGSHWPTLRNHGDAIVIRDSSGILLDSLSYSPGWGGSEQALERRTTQVLPLKANFGVDPNGFGSPGSANRIPADKTPPKLRQMHIVNNSEIVLLFSEPISGATATKSSNYTINPSRHIQLITAIQDTITLYLSDKLQSGQRYSVTIRHLQDIFGNTIPSSISQHATYLKFSGAQRGDVIINEIMHSGEPEFVELYNPTDYNFDLSGWTINDDKTTATIDANTRLIAGSYLVLTGSNHLAAKLDNSIHISSLPHFNVHSNDVYIKDKNGQIIDSLYYTPAFGGTADGKSTERIDPKAASNDPSNFSTSIAPSGSTPGKKNSVYKKDITPPVLHFAKVLRANTIEVYFNEFIKLTQDTRFNVNNNELTVVHFDSAQGNTILLKTLGEIPRDTKLTLKASNLTDVRGNTSKSLTIPVARPAQKGNVVINEVMYDPIKDPNDNIPDQGEYIELRNTAKYAVSLEGISLHDEPEENGNVHTIQFVTTKGKYIPAGKTALIYSDTSLQYSKSRIATFFHLTDKHQSRILRADRTTLSLASSGDAIYLTGKTGTTIDSIHYDESWQNPNLISTDGISLERINPNGSSDTPSNWGSSVAELGGTPNEENTLYQEPENDPQTKVGITLSPNPFSPDGDGYDDRLYISYKLDDSNYLITVDIYDRYGRKVRKLANNKPAGLQGRLIWDGLKNTGRRNRIGIYIVIFKAHDSANGYNKVFKKTVVLARRLY